MDKSIVGKLIMFSFDQQEKPAGRWHSNWKREVATTYNILHNCTLTVLRPFIHTLLYQLKFLFFSLYSLLNCVFIWTGMRSTSDLKLMDTLPKYTAVPPSELELSEELLRQREDDTYWRSRRWDSIKRAALVCIPFIIGVLGATIYHELDSGMSHVKFTNCGKSAEEARSNGCIYEPMQRSWIPPECYFSEPSDEYEDPFSNRQWFLDENFTQPATEDTLVRLRRGDNITAYTHYFHDEHCLYSWRKLALAVEYGKTVIESKTADLAHSAHCSKSLARKIVLAESGHSFPFEGFPAYSTSPVMFQTCVRLKYRR